MPELFVMPAPVMFKSVSSLVPIANVKGLAPAPKLKAFTSSSVESEIAVVFETAKVATSSGPFGTIAGVQFAAVFQSPVVGLRFQVALPACPSVGVSTSNNVDKRPPRNVEQKRPLAKRERGN